MDRSVPNVALLTPCRRQLELKFEFGPLPKVVLTCTFARKKPKTKPEQKVLEMDLGGNAKELEYFAFSTSSDPGMPPFIAMRFKPSAKNGLANMPNAYEQGKWDAGSKFTEEWRKGMIVMVPKTNQVRKCVRGQRRRRLTGGGGGTTHGNPLDSISNLAKTRPHLSPSLPSLRSRSSRGSRRTSWTS